MRHLTFPGVDPSAGKSEPVGTAVLREWRRLAAAFAENDRGRSIVLAPYGGTADAIAIRADVARPGASVMKVPLVATVLAATAAGELNLRQQVKLSALRSSQWPSVADALPEELSISLHEICALAIATSDNPCAGYLTRLLGFDRVNRWMRAIGLSSASRFAAGYDDEEIAASGRDNRITAEDCLRLLKEVFSVDAYTPLRRFLFNNIRNQRIPRLLADDVHVAHKTGSLEGVVNDVGLVVYRDVAFAAIFLCEDQQDPVATEDEIARTAHRSLAALIEHGERTARNPPGAIGSQKLPS